MEVKYFGVVKLRLEYNCTMSNNILGNHICHNLNSLFIQLHTAGKKSQISAESALQQQYKKAI